MRKESNNQARPFPGTIPFGASVCRSAAAILLLTGSTLTMIGCDQQPDENANSQADSSAAQPTVTEDNYTILYDEPGTPLGDFSNLIRIGNRMFGLTMTRNSIHGLDLTDTVPPQIVGGHEFVPGGGKYVKSRKLRIEEFMLPPGSQMVQVNVSLNLTQGVGKTPNPLAIKSLRGVEKDAYVPGPILQDSIGNSYWPSGYILKTNIGENMTEIFMDRGRQFKNLNKLPRLSRNKPQELILLFYVNKGVTITSFSYGGGQPKFTFSLEIPER